MPRTWPEEILHQYSEDSKHNALEIENIRSISGFQPWLSLRTLHVG